MTRVSVGTLVSEAIDKMDASDPEGALVAICAAVDRTAREEYCKPGTESYKRFVRENFHLIIPTVFGKHDIGGMKFAFGHQSPRPEHTKGDSWTIEDVLYHAVRCGLYHDAELLPNIKFVESATLSGGGDQIEISASLVCGLIAAVVLTPCNRSQVAPKDGILNYRGIPLPISKLWGRRAEFLWLVDVLD
ncbi:hypothetical protein LCGC14_1814930 [marine sediment metagenome]|uniref:Uncharacterized protein n=1 Tax=marine sediment metagenome TaxID=412755 RepID=A0A0F9GKI4_9ZZZZ